MSPEQWLQVRALFERICDSSPDRQARQLQQATEPAVVVDRVVAMLAAEQAGRLGEHLADQAPDLVQALSCGQRLGQVLGPYTIEALIDTGGMGEIYRAQRSDGSYQAQVAIKFVSLPSAEMAARFERERQILARLEHPNIARLLDGGVDPQGAPYLVMEYIDGLPIDQYCDQNQLTIEARIRLFLNVISAISMAHRQLVVHRDIKPDNIMIDGHGQAKLLDFGIGKDLDSNFQGDSPGETQPFLMTPGYAAPEQFSGGVVGTQTDIFQLGLLLDELLCGVAARALETLPVEQVVQHCLEQPLVPRDRFLAANNRHLIARQRGSSSNRLAAQLGGDLSLILAKAYAQEPEHRYHSADALADDLRNFLAGRPVKAHHPSQLYLLKKFFLRHQWGAAVSLIATLVLCISLVFSVNQALEAQAQRRLAQSESDQHERVKNFLLDIFRNADPTVNPGQSITARDLLQRAAEQQSRQDMSQRTQASVSLTIGSSYYGLGLLLEAEPLLIKALAQFSALGDTVNKDYADAAYTLGELHQSRLAHDKALKYHRLAWETRQQLYGEAHPELVSSLLGLARAMRDSHPKNEVLGWYQRALDMIVQYAGRQSPDYARALGKLANYFASRLEYEAAFPISEDALKIGHRTLDDLDPELAALELLHGSIASDSGRLVMAQAHLDEAWRIFSRVYGADHPRSLSTLANRAALAIYQDRFDQAVSLYDQYLQSLIRVYGDHSPKVAFGWATLGVAHSKAGHYQQSFAANDRSLEILTTMQLLTDPLHPLALYWRGETLRAMDQPQEALRVFQQALDSPGINPLTKRYFAVCVQMAEVLLEMGQPEQALARAEQAQALLAEDAHSDQQQVNALLNKIHMALN